MDGAGQPANWAMISRRGGLLVSQACKEAEAIVRQNPDRLRVNYHCLGKDLLWSAILQAREANPSFRYYHVSSRCLERNHSGVKMTNKILLSDAAIDPGCAGKFVFVPIYNTAPGFPSWFLQKSAYEILYDTTMLISRLFRLSLVDAEASETIEAPSPHLVNSP
jgi:hypothetical protein